MRLGPCAPLAIIAPPVAAPALCCFEDGLVPLATSAPPVACHFVSQMVRSLFENKRRDFKRLSAMRGYMFTCGIGYFARTALCKMALIPELLLFLR